MPAPTITDVIPSSGIPDGGTPVTIEGTNFKHGVEVTIGGAPAISVIRVSDTEIQCNTPPHSPTAADVVATNTNGDISNTFTYTYDAPPIVDPPSIEFGPITGGQPVTINGDGFKAGATVSFGGAPATNVNFVDANTLTCNTPANAPGAVDVIVINTDGQVGTFTAGFIFNGPPTIIDVTPPSGPTTGAVLTLQGEGFQLGALVSLTDSAGTVTAANNVQVINSNLISCDTPPGLPAGVFDVRVTNPAPDNQSGFFGAGFVCTDPPTVTLINPNGGSANGGTQVAVTGTNLQDGATVNIGGAPVGNVTFIDASTLLCITPPHFSGAVDVVVTNPNGQLGTLANGYTYTGPPSIMNVNPPNGPSEGGETIDITGSGFQVGLSVLFGGAPANNIVPGGTPATAFQCDTPAHAPGVVNVVVINPDGQAGTFTAGYIFDYPLPTIASVGPAEGTKHGGTRVTVSGTGFEPGASVEFDGVPAIIISIVNNTQIVVETPAHNSGDVNVTVSNLDGQTAILPLGYSYTN